MTDVPPMSRQALEAGRPDLHLHDHAVCSYATQEEMLAALAVFVGEGRARNEQMVFVHSFPTDEEAWAFVARAVPDISEPRERSLVLVSLYESAFEGGARRIDVEHVGRVVEELVHTAEKAGRRGTRLFVDASRSYFAADRVREWFEFESWLGRKLQAKVGLVCAYQRADIMRPEVLPDVLRTHAYRFDAAP